jgi:hypothetical protein
MHPQGSPQTNARPAIPPAAEDIQAVLGRFQAWTETHHQANRRVKPPAEEKGPRAAKRRPEKNKVEGLREVSYEEALRTALPRRKASSGAALNKASAVSGKAAEPMPSKQRSAPAPTPEIRKEQARPSAVKADSADFRQALAQSIAARVSAPPVATHALVPVARPSVLSVRFATAERKQITARAAEAGLSTSAYVRRCAIEVEQLRSQVKQLMDATQYGAANPAPAVLPVPGIWDWVRRTFLRRTPSKLVLTA